MQNIIVTIATNIFWRFHLVQLLENLNNQDFTTLGFEEYSCRVLDTLGWQERSYS